MNLRKNKIIYNLFIYFIFLSHALAHAPLNSNIYEIQVHIKLKSIFLASIRQGEGGVIT